MTTSVRRKRPDRYHHGDLRRALIDAALKLIEEQGVEAVTTRALARRLGVSHAAPGHHFRDREALLAELATEGFRAFADRLEAAAAAVADGDAAERLIAIGRAYVAFAAEHPSYLRLMFGRALTAECEQSAPVSEPLRCESERAFKALTDVVEALAASSGERRSAAADAKELAFAAWSLVHGMAMLWIDGPARREIGSRRALDAVAERILRRSVEGLVPAPGRRR